MKKDKKLIEYKISSESKVLKFKTGSTMPQEINSVYFCAFFDYKDKEPKFAEALVTLKLKSIKCINNRLAAYEFEVLDFGLEVNGTRFTIDALYDLLKDEDKSDFNYFYFSKLTDEEVNNKSYLEDDFWNVYDKKLMDEFLASKKQIVNFKLKNNVQLNY